MSRFGIFVLMLWSLMMCSYGFTMDRAVVFVPPAWDTAPSLDTYQRVFVDPAMKEMQVTGMNRILQTEDAKISENMLENQTRKKKSTTEKVEMKLIEIKPINEIASAMRNDVSDSFEENANAVTPRNIILLLIDERDHEKKEENSWKDYKERLPFAIEGVLQNCRDKIENANFSMDNASTSEKKEKSCNCERILFSNIKELLSWATHTRGMTTGAVSSNNFSIPFFPKYESSSNKSNAKLELRKSKRNSNDGWQVIDLSDRTSSVSPLITEDSKTDGDMNYDTTWDIFYILSKIRMAFFRSLLESLHKNDDGVFKNEFSSRKQSFLQSTAINLIEKTIRELKSVPNDKGYMLVAVVPRSEGAAAVDLLQRETSLKNTLLIVTQICVGDQVPVSFAARGPNCRIFREAKVIDELPILIKKAIITSNCYDTECMNQQRRDIPIELRVSTGIISQELPAEKRVIRNTNIEKLVR
ncbi:hypothetical protein ALC57_04632 [Trachymyrmex cornetzi]|uniref:Uncharacterized protein n=1 Tax=Trachymyrmex cornetzi TaxID=471704 RepID=A0A195EDC4_9HYME|nr:hypothetical protein ALC57_04632 [Trachymyrmex cornetzi]